MANTLLRNKKLNNLIRQMVIEVIRETFNDPDYGLPLTTETIRRLKKSIKSKKDGRLISLEEIVKKYSK
jgi:hypothetical protein